MSKVIHNVEQGTQEWLDLRSGKKTASETTMLMGNFGGMKKLYRVKHGLESVFVTPAMSYGTEMEPVARKRVEEELDRPLEPLVISDGEFLASLDGFGGVDGDNLGTTVLAEIKCPASKDTGALWASVSDLSSSPKQRCGYYWFQLVQQYMVCPADEVVFFVYIDDDTWGIVYVPIADLEADIPELLAKWAEYDQYVPIEAVVREDAEWTNLAASYISAKTAQDALAKQVKKLGDEIKSLTDVPAKGGGVEVRHAQGSVNKAKALDDSGIEYDKEKYRGKKKVSLVLTK